MDAPFQCEEHSIDNLRPIRVIVIGAGPCGIISAIRLCQRIKNISIQIYDKNGEFRRYMVSTSISGVGVIFLHFRIN